MKRKFYDLESPKEIIATRTRPEKPKASIEFSFSYSCKKDGSKKLKFPFISFGNSGNFRNITSLNYQADSESIILSKFDEIKFKSEDVNVLKEFLKSEIRLEAEKKGE